MGDEIIVKLAMRGVDSITILQVGSRLPRSCLSDECRYAACGEISAATN